MLMVAGTLTTLGGVYLLTIGLVTSVLAIICGIAGSYLVQRLSF